MNNRRSFPHFHGPRTPNEDNALGLPTGTLDGIEEILNNAYNDSLHFGFWASVILVLMPYVLVHILWNASSKGMLRQHAAKGALRGLLLALIVQVVSVGLFFLVAYVATTLAMRG